MHSRSLLLALASVLASISAVSAVDSSLRNHIVARNIDLTGAAAQEASSRMARRHLLRNKKRQSPNTNLLSGTGGSTGNDLMSSVLNMVGGNTGTTGGNDVVSGQLGTNGQSNPVTVPEGRAPGDVTTPQQNPSSNTGSQQVGSENTGSGNLGGTQPANEGQGTGDQGTGTQGTGNQATGGQSTGVQGTGSQGTGSQGTGNQDTGSPGTGSQGTGTQGTGTQGTENQGTGTNSGSAPASQSSGSSSPGTSSTGSEGGQVTPGGCAHEDGPATGNPGWTCPSGGSGSTQPSSRDLSNLRFMKRQSGGAPSYLATVNSYRSKFCLPAMTYDASLEQSAATQGADSASKGAMTETPPNGQGTVMAEGLGSDFENSMLAWICEVRTTNLDGCTCKKIYDNGFQWTERGHYDFLVGKQASEFSSIGCSYNDALNGLWTCALGMSS